MKVGIFIRGIKNIFNPQMYHEIDIHIYK